MKEGIKAKRPGYIKLYPERWIFGSTRDEMTNAERAIWADFLCLAGLNDPPGQIDFTSLKRLAGQLHISVKLLKATLSRAMANGKVTVMRREADDSAISELKLDQIETKMGPPESIRSQIGIPLFSILITKWNEYQSEYLRQKPYREARRGKGDQPENPAPESVTQVTDKGEERRLEERKQEEIAEAPPSSNPLSPPLPSPPPPKAPPSGKTVKDDFLVLLRACPGYPFNEGSDSLLFELAAKKCPGTNIIQQTEKKIAWWKEHPDAFKGDPRQQLSDFINDRYKYMSRGGPQPVGALLGDLDGDHANWLKNLLRPPVKAKDEPC